MFPVIIKKYISIELYQVHRNAGTFHEILHLFSRHSKSSRAYYDYGKLPLVSGLSAVCMFKSAM